jgi:hypothetical protein
MASESRLGPVVLVWAALALVAPAAAETVPTPSAADKELARRHMDDGDQLVAQGKLAEALEAYLKADKLVGAVTTAHEVARVYEELGKLIEASEHYQRALALPPAPNEPPVVRQMRAQAAERVAALRPRIAMLTLVIEGGALAGDVKILIDGRPEPPGRRERLVNPGTHEVQARADGFKVARANVTVRDGERQEVKLVLEPLATTGAAPAEAQAAPPQPARADAAQAPAAPPSGGVPAAAWIGWGVGAVGFTLMAVTGGLAFDKASKLEDECAGKDFTAAACPDGKSIHDAGNTLANIANIGLVVGILGAGFGTVAFFTMRDPAGAGAQLGPRVAVGGAGLAGRW